MPRLPLLAVLLLVACGLLSLGCRPPEEVDDDTGTKSGGGARGQDGGLTACERALVSVQDCYEDAGEDAADYGITDRYCVQTDPGDGSLDAVFDCWTEAMRAGDCSTEAGFQAAYAEFSACT